MHSKCCPLTYLLCKRCTTLIYKFIHSSTGSCEGKCCKWTAGWVMRIFYLCCSVTVKYDIFVYACYILPYNNLSWVWGWDRKFRPENNSLHRKACLVMATRWSSGMGSSTLFSHKSVILFRAHYKIPHFFYFWKKKTLIFSWIRWDATLYNYWLQFR